MSFFISLISSLYNILISLFLVEYTFNNFSYSFNFSSAVVKVLPTLLFETFLIYAISLRDKSSS